MDEVASGLRRVSLGLCLLLQRLCLLFSSQGHVRVALRRVREVYRYLVIPAATDTSALGCPPFAVRNGLGDHLVQDHERGGGN